MNKLIRHPTYSLSEVNMQITQSAHAAPDFLASTESSYEQLATAALEGSLNPGYLLIYEQWKQSILLSDGITDEMNIEW